MRASFAKGPHKRCCFPLRIQKYCAGLLNGHSQALEWLEPLLHPLWILTISLGRQQSYLVLPTPSTPQPSLTLYQPTLVPWVTWITSQGPQSPREGGPPQPWKHWGFYAPVSLASGCQGQIGALGLRFQEGGVRRDRHGWPWPKRQELQGLDTWNTRGQVPLTDISIWAYGRGV